MAEDTLYKKLKGYHRQSFSTKTTLVSYRSLYTHLSSTRELALYNREGIRGSYIVFLCGHGWFSEDEELVRNNNRITSVELDTNIYSITGDQYYGERIQKLLPKLESEDTFRHIDNLINGEGPSKYLKKDGHNHNKYVLRYDYSFFLVKSETERFQKFLNY
jgi:hypothetical protein